MDNVHVVVYVQEVEEVVVEEAYAHDGGVHGGVQEEAVEVACVQKVGKTY